MVMLHGHHATACPLFNSGCLGQFWKAVVGNFSRAPKVVVEPDTALMSDPVVLAVNVEAIEVRIAPPHGDLNGVMEIGDRLITAQFLRSRMQRQIIGLTPLKTTLNW